MPALEGVESRYVREKVDAVEVANEKKKNSRDRVMKKEK